MVTHKQTNNRLILEQSDLISRKFGLCQASAKMLFTVCTVKFENVRTFKCKNSWPQSAVV